MSQLRIRITLPRLLRATTTLISLLIILRILWMVPIPDHTFNFVLQPKSEAVIRPMDDLAQNLENQNKTLFVNINRQPYFTSSMQCTDSKVENPGHHLSFRRFDLLAKLVYAYYYSIYSFVPDIFKHMYTAHLRTMNNFREHCVYRHRQSFDVKLPCKDKRGKNDFVSSFHNTIDSIRSHGFQSNTSQIPTNKNGVILNGAHRLAAAMILSKNATFQYLNTSMRPGWDYLFFERRGLQRNISDLIILEWMKLQLRLLQADRKVFIMSVFSDRRDKDDRVRKIVSLKCSIDNGILYEKKISVTKLGMSQLVRHMYGNQHWLPRKIHDMLSLFKKKELTVMFLFFFGKSLDEIKSCKYSVRNLYNYKSFKSSAHVPDSPQESFILAQMILNPNSVQFLNYGQNGLECLGIATELARRSSLEVVPTLPGIYVGREDLMIDSGSVMHLFNLRNRTDVDILFLHNIDKRVLGKRNGFNIEAHAFKSNTIGKGTSWGEYHYSELVKSKWDLFYDARNFGFCYGIKFVSLDQLIKYKHKRNQPQKDHRDINLIQNCCTSNKIERISHPAHDVK